MVRRVMDWVVPAVGAGAFWLFVQQLYPHLQTTSNGWLRHFGG